MNMILCSNKLSSNSLYDTRDNFQICLLEEVYSSVLSTSLSERYNMYCSILNDELIEEYQNSEDDVVFEEYGCLMQVLELIYEKIKKHYLRYMKDKKDDEADELKIASTIYGKSSTLFIKELNKRLNSSGINVQVVDLFVMYRIPDRDISKICNIVKNLINIDTIYEEDPIVFSWALKEMIS